MPNWVPPPTFSYNYPAAPDDMNILRNDLLALKDLMFRGPSTNVETLIKCDSPYNSPSEEEKVAAIHWIEHKADNLYYRINIKSEDTGHDVRLHITYRESPFADPADDMGEHIEEQTLTDKDTFYLFANDDAAVDISGWGLAVGTIYMVEVTVGATSNDNDDCWCEVQFLYEAP